MSQVAMQPVVELDVGIPVESKEAYLEAREFENSLSQTEHWSSGFGWDALDFQRQYTMPDSYQLLFDDMVRIVLWIRRRGYTFNNAYVSYYRCDEF